jgi:5-formyltetrahydrofolate cyclo-ligase
MAEPTPETRAARHRLRARRLALSRPERLSAERAIGAQLRRMGIFRRGAHVALYLAMRGEVDLGPQVADARRAGCTLYLPVVTSRRRALMRFAEWKADSALRRNCFGIEEPVASSGAGALPMRLDTVIVPVVGFDRQGHRLGMGAGYYDRALRRRLDGTRPWRRPRLVGVAFACQELEHIRPSWWDVPLDFIVTEGGVIEPNRRPMPDPIEDAS